MKRVKNWDKVLNNWVESALRRNFEWGEFDCALMAADCIRTLTGYDPVPELWGTYNTPLGAYRALKPFGHTLEGICNDRLGPPMNPKCAQRGDIVLIDLGKIQTLGVCIGTNILIMSNRPVSVPRKQLDIVKSWKI